MTTEAAPGTPAARERLAAIGEIAAEIAHELRNALQIISANVYLAKQDLARSEGNLTKIEKSARLAHGIVDDLMTLARGEPAHAEPVYLVDVLVLSREDLAERGATYDDRLEPSQLELRAHRGLLARCLHVLYENAIDASTPRAPLIETRAWTEGSRVIIEVTDNGPGVPDAIASAIFEPLVTTRIGGAGLGLALARRVIAAHAGSIVLARSPHKGDASTGATFRIELPRAGT